MELPYDRYTRTRYLPPPTIETYMQQRKLWPWNSAKEINTNFEMGDFEHKITLLIEIHVVVLHVDSEIIIIISHSGYLVHD